jgi:hypothetical protein
MRGTSRKFSPMFAATAAKALSAFHELLPPIRSTTDTFPVPRLISMAPARIASAADPAIYLVPKIPRTTEGKIMSRI